MGTGRWRGRMFVRAAAVVIAALVTSAGLGCAGDEDSASDSIRIAQTSQPDFLDPALSYSTNAWEALWLVYTPLLAYRHDEGTMGAELIPGLAESLPEVSEDGTRYRLRLRKDIEYSDGTPVRARDFEHTIKRVLHLESGGSAFFSGIRGAEAYQSEGRAKADIEGIETDDARRTVEIELEQPDATFSNVLAMNFAGLVPDGTPFRNLTEDPPPGVGPYALTESEPNRRFVLERNRGFDLPGIPSGQINRITTEIVTRTSRQAQDVITGRLDYMQDAPGDLQAQVQREHGDRFRTFPAAATYYLFLNVKAEPFDDERVRRAVSVGIDREAFARLYGGLLEPGCRLLPPGVPGHDPSAPCATRPDIPAARRLVRRAGAEGAEVDVWGSQTAQGRRVADLYADNLRRIGLEPKERLVADAVYLQTIGNQSTRAATGFTSWFQDFPHPFNFLFLVDGKTIQETNNRNVGNTDDPRLNAGIETLRRERDPERVAELGRALDRRLVERAWIVPLGHPRLTTFMSERMDFDNCTRIHPLYQNDYTSWCLKE